MSIAGFFSWWFDELRAVFSGARGTRRHAHALALDVSESQLVVTHIEKGRGREIGRLARDGAPGPRAETAASRDALVATVQSLRSRLELCEVRIDRSLALRRRVTLPAAAEENLRQVLGFEMERQTPFRADNVYYDFEIVERDRKNRQLTLDLRLSTRTLVDDALAMLGELHSEQIRAPVHVVAGEATGEDAPVILWFRPQGARGPGRSWAAALAVLNLALVAALITLPIVEQKEQLAAARQTLGQARDKASRAAELRERIIEKRAQLDYVSAARQAQPPIVQLLDELSERLPDGTSLTRFEVKDGALNLQGLSNAASSLIALLEGSPFLAGVRFSSPVVRQGNQGRDRFHLTAKLKTVPLSLESGSEAGSATTGAAAGEARRDAGEGEDS